MSTNPKLTDALGRLKSDDDAGPLLSIVAGSILAADRGEYCECTEPDVVVDGLMCGACLRRNKEQERKAVRRIAWAHDFVLDESSFMGWCSICTMPATADRHHGVSAVGTTSWGEEVIDA